ncbi:glutamyl-tRNA reductase [Collibacillus ludicampi]|uniref:Glutamyl-tRNA reductase n=1 Tax=Collibacillus ludicampi TaxID=2771369 RepID=A0AAV4L9Y0_9BACL|nr:glutamyl-tRNA reductase [Collibacillus ludicampi]GIM44639.1 glutamyl-tRNA reductase [Collibacillus ludicampi]
MNIMAVGLNYRTAPVEIRERFSLSPSDLSESINLLAQEKAIRERVIISTCNRTEVYAVVDHPSDGKRSIQSFLEYISGVRVEDFSPYIYTYVDQDAVRHLFRVACGLDSMILGETQILGQVRDSFLFAQQNGYTGAIFNNLFKRAVTVAKRAHTETDIGKNAVSVSYAAVELAKKIFEELTNKTVLIIGAGKMSELTVKHLHSAGARRVLVVNRTLERAKELAIKFRGEAFDMGHLGLALKQADIVISSTGSDHYIVTKPMLTEIMRLRRGRALFLIDIAVPRDLDPEINKLTNVYLYDIDDLEGVIAVNLQERAKEAEKIGYIIGEEMASFKQWLNTQAVIPLIAALRDKGEQIQRSVMKSLVNKLPDLSERDKWVLEKHTKLIVNQLLHEPIQHVKELALETNSELYLEAFARIFGLQPIQEEEPSFAHNDENATALFAGREEAATKVVSETKVTNLSLRKEASRWQQGAASCSMMR